MTVHRRGEDGRWSAVGAGAGETIGLTSIRAAIAVDDIYRDGLEDVASAESS